MPSPVRFPSGVSTAVKNTTLWNYPAQDPTKVYQFFDDFDRYSTTSDFPWVDTFVNSSSIANVADEPGGAVIITNTTTDNDSAQIQWHTEAFTIATGKKAWFKARVKVNEVIQSDYLIGLAVLDTTLQGSVSGAGVTDGIFFNKDDGDTQIDFNVNQNAGTVQKRIANVATAVADTYMIYGFEWDGARYVKVFINDVQVNSVDLTTTPSSYMPNTPLTVSFAIQQGEGTNAKTMTIDYVLAAIER